MRVFVSRYDGDATTTGAGLVRGGNGMPLVLNTVPTTTFVISPAPVLAMAVKVTVMLVASPAARTPRFVHAAVPAPLVSAEGTALT